MKKRSVLSCFVVSAVLLTACQSQPLSVAPSKPAAPAEQTQPINTIGGTTPKSVTSNTSTSNGSGNHQSGQKSTNRNSKTEKWYEGDNFDNTGFPKKFLALAKQGKIIATDFGIGTPQSTVTKAWGKGKPHSEDPSNVDYPDRNISIQFADGSIRLITASNIFLESVSGAQLKKDLGKPRIELDKGKYLYLEYEAGSYVMGVNVLKEHGFIESIMVVAP